MKSLQSELEQISQAPLEGFANFTKHIPEEWIGEALQSTGTATVRRRRLPAAMAVWLVIGMSFFRNRSVVNVVESLGLFMGGTKSVAPSAVPQARARLGPSPMHWLFYRLASSWAPVEAARDLFHRMEVYALDGVTFKLADTPKNRAAFGGPSNSAGECAHPVLRAVCLIAVRARMLIGASFGTYHQHEQLYAAELWDLLPIGSLCLFDKGHYAAAVVCRLMMRGCHFLCPLPSNVACEVIQTFSKDDCLVRVTLTAAARRANPDLPLTIVMRRIRIRAPRVTRKDGGTGQKSAPARRQYLLTSLLDPTKISADEIRGLYTERWEIENANDEVKTELLEREETLRSKSPEMVEQEVWGLLIGYNLVRYEMAQAARAAKVPPVRISFVYSLAVVRDEFIFLANAAPGSIPEQLARMRKNVSKLVLPPRRKRSYPRVVKAGRTRYPVKKAGRKRRPPRRQKA